MTEPRPEERPPTMIGPQLPLSWRMRERMSRVDHLRLDPNRQHLNTQWLPLNQRIRNTRSATFHRPSTAFRSRYAETKPASIEQFPPPWFSLIDGTASMAIAEVVPTAALAVFGIVELLEMILLKLSFKDVLLSQRVARQWEAVTTHSAKLQQNLFFQPKPATYAWLHDCRHDRYALDSNRDDLPEGSFMRKVPLNYELSDSEASSGMCTLKLSAHLHPLYKRGPFCTSFSSGSSEPRRNKHENNSLPSRSHPSEASWRKMFWRQPPTNIVGVEWFMHRGLYYMEEEYGEDDTLYYQPLESSNSNDPDPYETNDQNSFNVRIHGAEILNVRHESYHPGQFQARERRVVGGGYVTVGEILGMTEEWSEPRGVAVEKGLVFVFVNDRVFPNASEAGVSIVWDK